MDFAEQALLARKKLGLGQAEMAQKLGVTRSYYNELENRKRSAGRGIITSLKLVMSDIVNNVDTNRASLREDSPIPKGTDFEGGITEAKGIDSRVVAMREDYMPKFGEKKGLLTRAELEDYVIRYLDYAQKHEGGMAIAQATILKHLTVDIFEHLPEK